MPSRRLALALLAAAALGACAHQQDETEAERLLTDKEPYAFHRAMCTALSRTGQDAQAVPHARKMIALRPSDPEGHLMLGRALLGMELYPEARQELEAAIKLDAKLAAAHSAMGVLLDGTGQHREAERSHRRALALAGKAAAYHNNLGFCLYLQGRYGEAITAYRAALKLSPGSRRVHNNLGFAQARAGALEEAMKNFRVGGDEGMAHNNMGLALEARGELEPAFAHYVKSVAESDLQPTRKNLERVCRKLGRPVPRVLSTKKAELTDAVPAAQGPATQMGPTQEGGNQ